MNIMSYIRNKKEQFAEKRHIREVKNLQDTTKRLEVQAQREQQKAQINSVREEELKKYESARQVNAKFEKPNMLMSLGKGLASAIEKQKAVGKTNFNQKGTNRGTKNIQRQVSGSSGFGMTSSFGTQESSNNVFSQSSRPLDFGGARNPFDVKVRRKR